MLCTTFIGAAFARAPDGYLPAGFALPAACDQQMDTRAPLLHETRVPDVRAASYYRTASTKHVALALTCLYDLFDT